MYLEIFVFTRLDIVSTLKTTVQIRHSSITVIITNDQHSQKGPSCFCVRCQKPEVVGREFVAGNLSNDIGVNNA